MGNIYEIREGRVPGTVIRIELISYFLSNPRSMVTCDCLARELRYPREQILEQINKLIDLRIVGKNDVEGKEHYSYLPPFSNKVLKEKRFNNIKHIIARRP